MTIIFNDDSELTCSEIEIYGNVIEADGFRRVYICDVKKIIAS